MDEHKILIEKLTKISDAWKAQFEIPLSELLRRERLYIPPNLPLVWRVEDGILFLDNAWVAPVKYICQERLEQAVDWVNPVSMEVALIDGSAEIIITKCFGRYSIVSVQRTIYDEKRREKEDE